MDADTDNLSTTSTLEEIENSEDEFTAEGIIADGLIEDETRYLVEWTGYPLHQATWEPSDHLNDELLNEWEELKKKISRGEVKGFKIRRWRQAAEIALREKHARHEKRNALRIKRGEEPTDWVPPLEQRLQYMESYYPKDSPDSEGLDSEHDDIDFHRLDNPTAHQLNNAKSAVSYTIDSATESGAQIEKSRLGSRDSSNERLPENVASGVANKITNNPSSTQTTVIKEGKSPLVTQPKTTKTLNAAGSLPKGPKDASILTTKMLPSSTAKKAVVTKGSASSKSSAKMARHSITGNVFSGGIERKKRKTLQEVSSDPSQDPKILRARYARLLEKGSRDRENSAPAQIPKGLISLDPKAPQIPVASQSATTLQDKTHQQDDLIGEAMDLDTDQPALPRKGSLRRTHSDNATGMGEASQTHSRRKSVRWDDNVQLRSFESVEEVGPEPSLFFPDDNQTYSPLSMEEGEETEDTLSRDRFRAWRPPSPPRGQERQGSGTPKVDMQNIPKPCLLGGQASRSINLLFQSIPRNSLHHWVADFRARDRLVFSHTCTAQDFVQQFRSVPNQHPNLACGSVSAPTDQDALEMVADRLKLRSQGVLCYAGQYCVFMFPLKSEEWVSEASRIPNSGSPLQYIVFEPVNFAETDLTSGIQNSTDRERWERMLPKNLGRLTNLDCQTIFPSNLQRGSEKNYVFLAFPPRAVEEARLLVSWLKISSNAECIIYDSYTPGDWDRFVDVGQGAIIIHEDATWKIRLFPRMFEVLNRATGSNRATNETFAISIFQRGCAAFSAVGPRSTTDPAIGDIGLHRLYLSRRAFLMTPSFIMSEPQKARVFVNYFIKAFNVTGEVRLAVPANFEGWLADLVAERIERPVERDGRNNDEDITALAKLVQRIGTLVEDSSDDDLLSPLVFAPTRIDANDEQSLVNWFGWWSILNMDKYGRFYVLGSENFLSRIIKPLRYLKNIVNDPDRAMELLDHRDPADALPVNDSGISAQHHIEVQLIEDDDPQNLKGYLQMEQNRVMNTPCPLWLYFNPVGYWNDDMAFRCSDIRGTFATFSQWFNSLTSLERLQSKPKKGPCRNTLGGLFYTPDPGWESVVERGNTKLPRRPWLAFFRPANPHRPWKECELLIWDSRYRGRFRADQEAHVGDLDLVHRKFIRVVRDKNANQNRSFPLNKVWIGGWGDLEAGHKNPLDMTLDFLDKVVNSVWLRLPAPEHEMEGRGWKFVDLDERSYGESMDVDQGRDKVESVRDEAGKRDDFEFEEIDDAKMIFLPPKGKRNNGDSGSSMCKNTLWTRSMFSIKMGNEDSISFKFTPTKLWYGQQVSEGRGFNHIMVDTWKKLFQQLRISE